MLGHRSSLNISTFLTLLFFVISSSARSTTSVDLGSGKIISDVTVNRTKFPETMAAVDGIAAQKSRLSDVIAKFPKSFVTSLGDAGSANSYVCLRKKDGTVLKFESSEMGGAEKEITSIILFAKGTKVQKNHLVTLRFQKNLLVEASSSFVEEFN